MKKRKHTVEQIIRILREAEGAQMKADDICRKHNISPQTRPITAGRASMAAWI